VGRRFDGVGALSGGGATSRLLPDYPDEQRSTILDLLFKPMFGASLHLLKVEVGGDTFSGCGTEPSFMHTRDDFSAVRGYEWFLMQESLARNPSTLGYSLSWGFPSWVGDSAHYPLTEDMANYEADFCATAKAHYNYTCDYLGIWNEAAWSVDYVVELRRALDSRQMQASELVVSDNAVRSSFDTIVSQCSSNSSMDAATAVIGGHYPSGSNSTALSLASGKPLWASEDSSSYFDWQGGMCWGRILNWNYLYGHMTSTIMWNLVSSYYERLHWYGDSLMGAAQPWSGYFNVTSPLWVNAHWGQFVQPGWHFLEVGDGAGQLPGGGTYVTLVEPPDNVWRSITSRRAGEAVETVAERTAAWLGTRDAYRGRKHSQAHAQRLVNSAHAAGGADWVIQLETSVKEHSMCIRSNPSGDWAIADTQNVTFVLPPQLARPPTAVVFKSVLFTSPSEPERMLFERQAPVPIDPATGAFTVVMHPDTVLSVASSDRGQNKGVFEPPPAESAFPAVWEDDFEAPAPQTMTRFLSDMTGSFATALRADGDGQAYLQNVTSQPMSWHPPNDDSLFPLSILGSWDTADANISVTASALSNATFDPVDGNPIVSVAACSDSDASQQWLWNSSKAYGPTLSSASGGGGEACLMVDGCSLSANTPLWMWPCAPKPEGCDSKNQMWTLSAETGQLATALDGQCVTVMPEGAGPYQAIVTQPCATAPAPSGSAQQAWTFVPGNSPATGRLQLRGTSKCLSSSPPPSARPTNATNVAVGVRLGGSSPALMQNMAYSSTWFEYGYWLTVSGNGNWTLSVGSKAVPEGKAELESARQAVREQAEHGRRLEALLGSGDSRRILAQGSTGRPLAPGVHRALSLAAIGSTLTSRIDGVVVANVTDSTYTIGWAGISSGWHRAEFDDLLLQSTPMAA
jgi:hypothetical protein